ncbi:MAG TPA: substrate-binding domain-containing protein [Candidatus Limnocylindria bacterium]|jgi:D-xylose transport system substrate-binding protein|nr:substrate-binding domain-containing protein [Candidatus Limnocylindria bacterium]
MRIPRPAALVAVAAILLAACSPGASTTPGGSTAASASQAASCTVAVSWNNFQQPRWAAADQPNIKKVIEDGGGTYMDHDANLDAEQQLTDVDTFISQGANVIIMLAQDQNAILPALQKAKDAGIPVIAYDRLIEDPDILYITFNNAGVGQAEAEALLKKVPEGNYVLIKGDPGDPNASTFLPQGWEAAGLKDAIDSGKITVLNKDGDKWPDNYGTFTDAWSTETAQKNMEAIIDKANADNKKIDAVLAENDSTAVGVAQALEGKNYGFPPLSGQDGDPTNLNNVALGKQYVDVWKNANELGKAAGQAALQLCQGKAMADISIDVDSTVAPLDGNSPTDFDTPGGNTVKSLILQPTPITAENLGDVINAGWWVTKDDICEGVKAGDPGADACGV